VTPTGDATLDRKFTPQELREVIAHAEDLIGAPLDDLLTAHRLGASSPTPPQYSHRLIDLLLRLRKAADNPADALALDVASVAIVEVSAVVFTFDEWRDDPAWSEFQLAIQDPRHYLHATATLTVASALRQHHSKTEIVASSTPGSSPDLRMVVGDEHGLAVEVKTSHSLSQRSEPMTAAAAVPFVEKSLKDLGSGFKRQLARGQPGVLVIGGFHIDPDTFRALGDAAAVVLGRGRQRTHLLAIVISHTRYITPSGRMLAMAHETRIVSNPQYLGDLRFVGEWAGDWHLEKVDRS
jgi:hypothetical protein